MRGVATIGDERAAGPGMREVQEHGEGTRPLRFNGGGKGSIATTEEPPADVDEGFLDGESLLL